MNKKALLVDTNRAAYPIYQALCALDLDVCVVGARPDDPVAKLARRYVPLNYSDADQLAAFVDAEGFDFVVPGTTDLSYEVCAQINAGRFPGIESVENTAAINQKHAFRALAGSLELPIPRVLTLSEAAAGEPVIVKPVDSFSGRGMCILKQPTPGALEAAYETACTASKSGKALIEELVEGQLYSHSAFIRAGEVVADFVVQEDCIASPFAVDTSRLAARFPADMLAALRGNIRQLAAALNLVDGLVHTQFIANAERYWIIEVTRRCPGDIYSLLIAYSTGYAYAASYAAPFVGRSAADLSEEITRQRIIRHTASPTTEESLWGFSFNGPVNIRLFVPLVTSGATLQPGPAGRAGIFFFHSESEKEEENLYQQLLANTLYSFH